MRDAKVTQLLAGLPADMRRRLTAFVASPYFNRVSRLSELLQVLDQHVLARPQHPWTEEETFALVQPGRPFDRNRLRKDCSALVALALDFLAHERYQQAPHQRAIHLLDALDTLGFGQLFESTHAQALAHIATGEAPPMEQQQAHIQAQTIRYRHDLQQPARSSSVDLDALIGRADSLHLVQRMELLYLQLNHRLVTGAGATRDDSAFVAQVAEALPTLPAKARMHYHLYQCTRHPDQETHYTAFRAELAASTLPQPDAEEMYTAALNYCARRINAGQPHYRHESLHLYRDMLDNGLLGADTALLSAHFKNIVVIASQAGAHAWARAFVHRWHIALPQDVHHNAYHFALGYIDYCEGRLQEAQPHLYQVLHDFADVFYGVDARITLLRCHYEAQDQRLDSLLDSTRMYIKRSRALSGQRKANLQAFLRYLRRLAQLPRHDREAQARLREDILGGRKLAHAQWLLDHLDALAAHDAH